MDLAKVQTRWHLWRLAVVVGVMFGFGFALVPVYNVLCQWVNLNGKDEGMLLAANVQEQPDLSRSVTVELVTTVNGGRPWKFAAETQKMQVHPGQLYTVNFYAENTQDHDVVAQAVPSVVPWNAAKYLRKTECFCFKQQPFRAGEGKHMPVRFMLDRELPTDVDTVTLSYTFFDVTELVQR